MTNADRTIKLKRRYPESKTEDITDAFNRGVTYGKTIERGTCHDVYPEATFCFTCSKCGHVRVFVQGWNDRSNSRQDEFRFCPICGRKVVEA